MCGWVCKKSLGTVTISYYHLPAIIKDVGSLTGDNRHGGTETKQNY